MKTLPVDYALHIAQPVTTLAHALKITRLDGEVFGWTSHDRDAYDLLSDAVWYRARPGLSASAIETSAGFTVGNVELRTLHDESVFTTADILGRVWDNAAFVLFRYNWELTGNSPAAGVEYLLAGTLGELELRTNEVVVELRDLRQYLQHAIGSVSSKTCRYRLGVNNGRDSLCPVNLNLFTYPMSVTSVTNNQQFRDNARTEGENWFTEGSITWLSGFNAGLSQKIKTYDFTLKEFVLARAMILNVQVGDTALIRAGCLKRWDLDCRDKFDALLDFGGEKDRPTVDDLTKPVSISV